MHAILTIMKALSDKNRLRVIAALQAHDELCACQITELLQVTAATVSRHMGLLLQAGLVESRKKGRWTYYRLRTSRPTPVEPVFNWLRENLQATPEIEQDRRIIDRILSMDKEDLCRRQRGEACCPRPADKPQRCLKNEKPNRSG